MSKYSEYWSSSGKTNINYKATAPRYVKNEIKDMLWIRLCLQTQDYSFSLAFCQPDSDGVRVLEANTSCAAWVWASYHKLSNSKPRAERKFDVSEFKQKYIGFS